MPVVSPGRDAAGTLMLRFIADFEATEASD